MALLNFAIVPARLFWDVRDTFNQVTLNPSQATRPDNLESFNYFTTGPRAMIGLGQNLALTLFGTYSDVAYSSRSATTEDADSQRCAAGATLSRSISDQANAYLSFNTQKVEFKDDVIGVPDPDYTRQEAYVGYHVSGSRTFADVSAGATRPDPAADGQDSTSAFLARLSLARKLTPSSTLRFNASQQIGDSADMTRFRLRPPDGRRGFAGLRHQRSVPRPTSMSSAGISAARAPRSALTGTISEDRYGSATVLNRDSEQARAVFTRRLRPTLDLNLVVNYLKEDFQNVSLVNKQLDEIVALTWQAGRRLGVTFQYSHSKRDSDQGDGTLHRESNRCGSVVQPPGRLTGHSRPRRAARSGSHLLVGARGGALSVRGLSAVRGVARQAAKETGSGRRVPAGRHRRDLGLQRTSSYRSDGAKQAARRTIRRSCWTSS